MDRFSLATFNMYSGFDALEIFSRFKDEKTMIWAGVEVARGFQKSRPEERVKKAAREFTELKPDFIALQEVTSFDVATNLPLIKGFSVDFLKILIDELNAALKDEGISYSSISMDNIVVDEKLTYRGVKGAFKYIDREAILYKREFELSGELLARKLSSHRPPHILGRTVFYRGLLGAVVRSKEGEYLRLFSTHLDQSDLGEIHQAQIGEVLSISTPAEHTSDCEILLAGDLNTTEGSLTYKDVIKAGFRDSYRDVVGGSPSKTEITLKRPARRVDYIFGRLNRFRAVQSGVIMKNGSGFDPSDHYGVLTSFERFGSLY